MNTELIENAIQSARYLISKELDSIRNEELRDEFEETLEKLNLALHELKVE